MTPSSHREREIGAGMFIGCRSDNLPLPAVTMTSRLSSQSWDVVNDPNAILVQQTVPETQLGS